MEFRYLLPKLLSKAFIGFILVVAGYLLLVLTTRVIPVLAATETIRPTDSYSNEVWTSPTSGYDGNTNTSASRSDLNKTPSISFGGSSLGETTNAWQSKSQSWTAATLYLTFSKTAGSNDTVEVLVTDQNGNLQHTIVASTSGAVSKQEFSRALNSANWGGSGFPNIANLRIRVNGNKSGGPDGATSYMYDIRIDGTYTPGNLTVDIVDSGGNPVGSPSMAMSTVQTSFNCQTSTGTFGVSEERIRVSNTTASPAWTLTVAATSGSTATWSTGLLYYDFNDGGGSGCTDGADADSYAGQMTQDPSGGTITPQGGCSTTGLSLGSSASFIEGTTDSITLLSASASANTNCYWDLTGISVSQKIPSEQSVGNYSINMTLTVTAS